MGRQAKEIAEQNSWDGLIAEAQVLAQGMGQLLGSAPGRTRLDRLLNHVLKDLQPGLKSWALQQLLKLLESWKLALG